MLPSTRVEEAPYRLFEGKQGVFILDLLESGEFVDTSTGRLRLGGRWGTYDEGAKSADGKGSQLWLWIRRSKCRGADGLHSDLSSPASGSLDARRGGWFPRRASRKRTQALLRQVRVYFDVEGARAGAAGPRRGASRLRGHS